ncbi:hypothetical protein [Streptomyces sp. NPDC004728]|uniref:hypothetical protein n=1 Tax=Streptomyces sp. NPDC004728 TaxID=3154289 RepID=UPI0033B0A83E
MPRESSHGGAAEDEQHHDSSGAGLARRIRDPGDHRARPRDDDQAGCCGPAPMALTAECDQADGAADARIDGPGTALHAVLRRHS